MWRVGKGLTHVFCGDQPAAFCDTPEIAARIVAAMNAAEEVRHAPNLCEHGFVRESPNCSQCMARRSNAAEGTTDSNEAVSASMFDKPAAEPARKAVPTTKPCIGCSRIDGYHDFRCKAAR